MGVQLLGVSKEGRMHIVYSRCWGVDVHKKSIPACVLLREATGQGRQEIRRFETMTRDLLE